MTETLSQSLEKIKAGMSHSLTDSSKYELLPPSSGRQPDTQLASVPPYDNLASYDSLPLNIKREIAFQAFQIDVTSEFLASQFNLPVYTVKIWHREYQQSFK